MKITFDTHGNEKQKEAAKAWLSPDITDIVYGGAKGGGKSYLGCSLIFGDAFIYPETHYFIAREELNDLRKFTIPSIHEVFQHWGISDRYYNYNGKDSVFTLYNHSKVYLLAAKFLPRDPLFARFGSMQMTRGWAEETGEMHELAVKNLAISVGRWKNDKYNLAGKVLQTCNPTKNYLYRNYYKPWRDGELPGNASFIQALPTDNRKLDKGYIQHLKNTLSKNELERLLYGNWEYDDDPAKLMDYDSICDLWTNEHVKQGEMCITADIARLGNDKTVVYLWSGFVLLKSITLSKTEITETSKAIRQLATENSVPMSRTVVDEDGVGGGVKDILRCQGFVNNSRPLKEKVKIPNYDNLKSQCQFNVARMVNAREIWVRDKSIKDKLTEELELVKYKNPDKDGKVGVEPKDKLKELLGRSPDYLDAFMMRYFFELRSRKILASS